jgi:hypothetical protein
MMQSLQLLLRNGLFNDLSKHCIPVKLLKALTLEAQLHLNEQAFARGSRPPLRISFLCGFQHSF